MGHPGLLIQDYVAGIPIWYIPNTKDSQDENEAEDSLERTGSTTSPPPALSKDLGIDKKRIHVEELASSSASAHKTVGGETFALEDEQELFDAMDS
jgi:hypothetical protein